MPTFSEKFLSASSSIALLAGLSSLAFSGAAVAQSADDDEFFLDEIVVTAQRRSESLQDVPVSITALGQEDLVQRQVRDVNDLQAFAPNIFISTGTGTSSSARIFFRGVGEDESRGAIDPAVGIYVDGVYLGRTVGSLMDVVDLERIEVLRGPQGTLYGRNTNGGAIKLVSVRPQFENSGDIEAGYGENQRFELRGLANIALTDTTAARFVAQYKERDGFHRLNPNGDLNGNSRRVGDEEVLSLRGSLLHNFSENWSALIQVDYTKDDSDPIPSSIIAESDDPSVVTDVDNNIFTVEPAPGVTCASATPLIFRPVGCFDEFSSSVDIFGVALNLEGELGLFSVESITSYRTMEDNLSTHISFPFFQNTDQDQFSQELNFSSNFDGPFNFISGLYFYDEDVTLDSTFFSQFTVGVKTQAFAAFSQATYDLTEALTFTAGLRYTDEERDFTGANLSNQGSATPFSPNSRDETLNTDDVNYTLKLDYAFSDDLMIYGSYATGFKTPGFSPDCFSPTACFLPVEQEELASWEVGLRAEALDKRVRFNATYFYNDYENLQISATVPGLGFTRSNAGEARIQGIEVEFSLHPTSDLEVFGNLGWLDAEYRNLTELQAATLTNNGAACGGTSSVECALDLDLKNAPPLKFTLGFNYTTEGLGGVFDIGGDMAYEDDSFALVANPPGSIVEPGTTFNARVAYQPADGNWRVSLWGKNLTDREYFRASTAANQVYAVPPMTWGVDVGVSF